jgi:carbamoyltransferase
MRVLGIVIENDSGAAVVEDGRILAAMNEERICRMKMVIGFPRDSIREVLRLSGSTPADLDAVMVATTNAALVDELEPNGWFDYWTRTRQIAKPIDLASRLSPYRNRFPFLESAYYALQRPFYIHRRWAIPRILREEFGIQCPVHFVDHHFAHATSAYFTSGYRDALVISLDGGGDRKSSAVYAVRGGRFECLSETSSFDSLGNYYAYATHLCGFKPMRHEGKVTGLAAHGEPHYVPILREFIDEVNGRLVNRGGVAFFAAIQALERRLPKGWTRERLASSIQNHVEDVTRRFVSHWARRTGLRDVAVAGGVHANVRVNEEVHALPEVKRLFVHPHMGDGGLSVGAALAACVPGVLPQTMSADREPLRDVYLGTDLIPVDVERALQAEGLVPEHLNGPLEEHVAELLAKGYVVARATGRMEYGPRALGHRSILYHPTDPAVNDWLNKNLHRTEFMPFAPAVLFEERDRCMEDLAGAEHAAEFMTITFHCTPCARKHLPGVVHLDGTARPELVREDRKPGYYKIIQAFARRTGLPAIINTSFNMHEEPIVCSAADCVRAFLHGNLDSLAIGSHLVKHPSGIRHPIRPAAALNVAAALSGVM